MTSHMPGIDVPLSFLSHLNRKGCPHKKNILLCSISKIAVFKTRKGYSDLFIVLQSIAMHPCDIEPYPRWLLANWSSWGRILEQEENLGWKVQVRPQPLQSYEKLAIPEKWSMFAQNRLKGKKIHQTRRVANWKKNFLGLLILDLRKFMHIWAFHLNPFNDI